jgi:hypothetical protein
MWKIVVGVTHFSNDKNKREDQIWPSRLRFDYSIES